MYARHTFLRLNHDAAPINVCGSQAALRSWLAETPIAIVRSFRDGEDREAVPVGSALPAARDRARIGYSVAAGAIAEVIGRCPLSETLQVAPETWREKLQCLVDGMTAAGLVPLTYGSLAWQFVTGLPYIRETSDIDVAVKLSNRADLKAALSVLRAADEMRGPRIDGELIWDDEAAVNWRECDGVGAELLVKGPDGAALCARERMMERLAD